LKAENGICTRPPESREGFEPSTPGLKVRACTQDTSGPTADSNSADLAAWPGWILVESCARVQVPSGAPDSTAQLYLLRPATSTMTGTYDAPSRPEIRGTCTPRGVSLGSRGRVPFPAPQHVYTDEGWAFYPAFQVTHPPSAFQAHALQLRHRPSLIAVPVLDARHPERE